MRLIDADALNEALGVGKDCADCQYSVGGRFCHRGSDFVDACEAIADAPTVEPPRIKGRWERVSDDEIRKEPFGFMWVGTYLNYKCTNCGKYVHNELKGHADDRTKYCPDCGADMRETE